MVKKQRASQKKVSSPVKTASSAEETEETTDKSDQKTMLKKAEALDLLSGTKMPSSFRFREAEMRRIEQFLDTCARGQKKGVRFLMLTGAPGAGKTLTATTILGRCSCRTIYMNANIVKTLQEAQRMIARELLGEKGDTPQTTMQLIQQLEEAEFRQTCVVCIEEMELLFRSDPTPLTEDFMKLFLKKGVRLVLIGISNTIDTLLKSSEKFCFKMHDVENVIFAPYTAEHIGEIMKDKLSEVREKTEVEIGFSEKLIRYSAVKLQTLKKGDFRVCLEFLKAVVQLSLEQSSGVSAVVGIEEANAVFQRMNLSKHMNIEKLPYQQQLMLVAVHNYFRKHDALWVSPLHLQAHMQQLCHALRLDYSKHMLVEGLSELEQYSLLEVKQRREETRVLLKVGLGEIAAAFADSPLLKKYFSP